MGDDEPPKKKRGRPPKDAIQPPAKKRGHPPESGKKKKGHTPGSGKKKEARHSCAIEKAPAPSAPNLRTQLELQGMLYTATSTICGSYKNLGDAADKGTFEFSGVKTPKPRQVSYYCIISALQYLC